MKLDPSRSWTRNRAEEARDKKLFVKRPYQVESRRTNKFRRDLLKVVRRQANKKKKKSAEKG